MTTAIVAMLVIIIVLLGVVIARLGEQNDLKKSMAKAYHALAESLAGQATRTLGNVEKTVEKGITDAAAVVAQATGNPLSGDKFPRPPLPPADA